MKIVKLMGGLGNQMFQYAFAKNIENVFYDINWFLRDYNRIRNVQHLNLELENFNVKNKYATNEQIKDCLKESLVARSLTNLQKIYGIKIFNTNRVYEKLRNEYQPNLFDISGDVYYDGYFQNIKYFESFRSELLYEFTPQKELVTENKKMLETILNTNSISISIRHANDYEKLGWALPSEYYNNAMEYIASQFSDCKFFVFTDNIHWCKNNLDNRFDLIYANSKDDNCGYVCGIELMKNCKNNIISNSTYPWWAAWLNNNPNKIVVIPKTWIEKKGIIRVTYEGLYDSNWIRI